ncbi:MAG: hypothetical protein GX323_10465 [Clostridiales bacterium]|nr:hypothetical protein [Clostridiales bacterium]
MAEERQVAYEDFIDVDGRYVIDGNLLRGANPELIVDNLIRLIFECEDKQGIHVIALSDRDLICFKYDNQNKKYEFFHESTYNSKKKVVTPLTLEEAVDFCIGFYQEAYEAEDTEEDGDGIRAKAIEHLEILMQQCRQEKQPNVIDFSNGDLLKIVPKVSKEINSKEIVCVQIYYNDAPTKTDTLIYEDYIGEDNNGVFVATHCFLFYDVVDMYVAASLENNEKEALDNISNRIKMCQRGQHL